MKALVKDGGLVSVRGWSLVSRLEPHQVRIRVSIAGFCRTDLYAAQGRLETLPRLVLGHEFSGIVIGRGEAVTDLSLGQKVAAFPWLGCGRCPGCVRPGPVFSCWDGRMMGVMLDGAFAEEVIVERSLVHALPDSVSLVAGAYFEPLAAALAITRAGLDPRSHGLVWGQHRVALLTHRLLLRKGFSNLELRPLGEALPANHYDFIVENFLQPDSLNRALQALRPGGKLILKSRQPGLMGMDCRLAVTKELTIQAVHYGSLAEALQLLRDEGELLRDLIGTFHPLEDWQKLFEESLSEERSKRFFVLNEDDVRAD